MTEPFTTQDRKLALALALAGCSFTPCEEYGPATNTYTPSVLRNKIDPRTRKPFLAKEGVTTEQFEEAASEAVRQRIPGIVDYHFVRNVVFERAQKAWDNMVDEMARAQQEGRAPNIPVISEEVVMQVIYLQRCGEKEFSKSAFIKPPECAIGEVQKQEIAIPDSHNPSETGPMPKVKYTGSMKRWTLGCSQDMREALKL